VKPNEVTADNAAKVWDWLQTRGGIAVWQSELIGDCSSGMTTPRFDKHGAPGTSPHWRCPGPPLLITDTAEVVVISETFRATQDRPGIESQH
jgi:hypothetical protein